MEFINPLAWAVILMVLGCGLAVLEVFIPSGGVLSFFSAVSASGRSRRDALL